MNQLSISPKGVDLIKHYEGCKLQSYLCPAGICTIGYGHTGSDVLPKMTITSDQATALLMRDIASCEAQVRRLVSVPVTQGQWDALISFAFNLGAGALAHSTLLKLLNAGGAATAADQFMAWNKATVNGQRVVLPGLTARRSAERDLFLGK